MAWKWLGTGILIVVIINRHKENSENSDRLVHRQHDKISLIRMEYTRWQFAGNTLHSKHF